LHEHVATERDGDDLVRVRVERRAELSKERAGHHGLAGALTWLEFVSVSEAVDDLVAGIQHLTGHIAEPNRDEHLVAVQA